MEKKNVVEYGIILEYPPPGRAGCMEAAYVIVPRSDQNDVYWLLAIPTTKIWTQLMFYGL